MAEVDGERNVIKSKVLRRWPTAAPHTCMLKGLTTVTTFPRPLNLRALKVIYEGFRHTGKHMMSPLKNTRNALKEGCVLLVRRSELEQ